MSIGPWVQVLNKCTEQLYGVYLISKRIDTFIHRLSVPCNFVAFAAAFSLGTLDPGGEKLGEKLGVGTWEGRCARVGCGVVGCRSIKPEGINK